MICTDVKYIQYMQTYCMSVDTRMYKPGQAAYTVFLFKIVVLLERRQEDSLVGEARNIQ